MAARVRPPPALGERAGRSRVHDGAASAAQGGEHRRARLHLAMRGMGCGVHCAPCRSSPAQSRCTARGSAHRGSARTPTPCECAATDPRVASLQAHGRRAISTGALRQRVPDARGDEDARWRRRDASWAIWKLVDGPNDPAGAVRGRCSVCQVLGAQAAHPSAHSPESWSSPRRRVDQRPLSGRRG